MDADCEGQVSGTAWFHTGQHPAAGWKVMSIRAAALTSMQVARLRGAGPGSMLPVCSATGKEDAAKRIMDTDCEGQVRVRAKRKQLKRLSVQSKILEAVSSEKKLFRRLYP